MIKNKKMINLCGWISSIAFAISAAPQALKSILDGHSNGVAWGLIILWFIGEIFGLIYVWFGFEKKSIPLIVNFGGNLIFVAIITYYKL